MTAWVILLPLAAYTSIGVLCVLVWGRRAWATEPIKQYMADHGYEAALEKVHHNKLNLMVCWPVLLPMAAGKKFFGRILEASNPHRQHQADYDRSVASYNELTELERQAGLKLSAQMPQPWCACLRDTGERDPHEAEIQRRVEIELMQEAARHGTRTRMHTNLMTIKEELFRLGMWR